MEPVISYTEKEKLILRPVIWALIQSQASAVSLRELY